ncbi:uncharacterized protein LOC134809095 [Pan troglodytes]|uniref:uncharacterized protein LOC134809095 n=1 Tax=Pan troglodytes TaxID=9598 RepID=UPI003013D092
MRARGRLPPVSAGRPIARLPGLCQLQFQTSRVTDSDSEQTQTDKRRRASSPISRSILGDPLTRGLVGLGNPGRAPRCYAQIISSPKKTTRVQSQSQAARIFTTSSNLVPPFHSIQEGPEKCECLLFIA